jgi:hypothetical protein
MHKAPVEMSKADFFDLPLTTRALRDSSFRNRNYYRDRWSWFYRLRPVDELVEPTMKRFLGRPLLGGSREAVNPDCKFVLEMFRDSGQADFSRKIYLYEYGKQSEAIAYMGDITAAMVIGERSSKARGPNN